MAATRTDPVAIGGTSLIRGAPLDIDLLGRLREFGKVDPLRQQVSAILRKYGTDAHVYLPGIGVINGLTAGNYLDSAGTTAATVDNPVGLVLDGAGSSSVVISVLNATAGVVGAGNLIFGAPISVVSGRAYKISYVITALVGQVSSGLIGQVSGTAQAVNWTGSYSEILIATATSTIGVGVVSRGAGVTSCTGSVTVTEFTGIHATQGTTANKPILRRGAVNKLAQSNDLTLWDKINAVVTAGQTDPLGGTSAFKVVCTTGGNEGIYAPTPSQSEGTNSPNARSFWARADSPVDLVINNTSGGSHKVVSLTTAWQFFTDLVTTTSQGSTWFKPSSTTPVYLWHPQTEAGSVVHDYIPTTTAPASSSTGNYWWQFADSTDVLSATFPAGYESATIINTAETGQVTSTAQNIVGTYEIRGAVIGNELITNGDFSNGTTNWQAAAVSGAVGGASISNVSGKLRVTNDATGVNYGLGSQGFTTVVGKRYRVTLERGATSTGATAFWYVGITPNGGGSTINLANQAGLTNVFIATATTSYINLGAILNTANAWAEWDNVSIKEITPEEYACFIFRTGLTASELAIMQQFSNRLAGV